MGPKQTDKHQTYSKRSDLWLPKVGGDERRNSRKVIKRYKRSRYLIFQDIYKRVDPKSYDEDNFFLSFYCTYMR